MSCSNVKIVVNTAIKSTNKARTKNIKLLLLAKLLPTELFFSQWGQRARPLMRELNKKVSPQWPQSTLHIPGTGERSMVLVALIVPGVYKTIILLQVDLGQEIFWAVELQMSKQLQLHLMYFFAGGGSLIAYGMFCDHHILGLIQLSTKVRSRSWRSRYLLSLPYKSHT